MERCVMGVLGVINMVSAYYVWISCRDQWDPLRVGAIVLVCFGLHHLVHAAVDSNWGKGESPKGE